MKHNKKGKKFSLFCCLILAVYASGFGRDLCAARIDAQGTSTEGKWN